jgi:hypothetical protein
MLGSGWPQSGGAIQPGVAGCGSGGHMISVPIGSSTVRELETRQRLRNINEKDIFF